VRFDVMQHTMRANHFTIVEGWQGQGALDAHAAAPHTKQYRDTYSRWLAVRSDEAAYTRPWNSGIAVPGP